MTNIKQPFARQKNIVVQKLGNETLIYDLNTNQAYCLNQTSTIIWGLCNGKNSFAEIRNEISTRLKTLVSKDLVYLALDQLQKDGLLEGEAESHFAGVPRREVIRKVGFASVVALPLVSSLVAPDAAMAQSCIVASGVSFVCTTNTDCCSGNCLSTRCCSPTSTGSAGFGASACHPTGTCPTAFAPLCCSGIAIDSISLLLVRLVKIYVHADHLRRAQQYLEIRQRQTNV